MTPTGPQKEYIFENGHRIGKLEQVTGKPPAPIRPGRSLSDYKQVYRPRNSKTLSPRFDVSAI